MTNYDELSQLLNAHVQLSHVLNQSINKTRKALKESSDSDRVLACVIMSVLMNDRESLQIGSSIDEDDIHDSMYEFCGYSLDPDDVELCIVAMADQGFITRENCADGFDVCIIKKVPGKC